MAFNLATGYVQLEQRGFSEVNAAIAQTKAGFQGLAASATFFSNVMSSTLGNTMADGAARLGNGIAGLASGMIRMVADAESAKISFETMLGSGAKANKILSELREFAAKTPLEFAGLRSNAQTLLQYGISAEKVLPALRMLGDVSGGSAQRMQSVTLAFGQISQNGKLNGEDLRQLVAVGFNPLNQIAQRTGETLGELRGRMEQGRVSVDEVTQAFKDATSEGGTFYKNLENKAASIEGLMSNISDDVTRAMETMGDSLAHAFNLKDMLKGSETGLAALAAGMKSWRFEIAAAARGMATFTVAYGISSAAVALYTTRTQAATAASIFFQSVLNPANLIKIGIGLAAAATSIALMNTEFKSLTEAVDETKTKIDQTTESVKEFYASWTGNEKVQIKGLGDFEKPNLNEMAKVLDAAVGQAKGVLPKNQVLPGAVEPEFIFGEMQDLVNKSGLLDMEKGLTETEKKVAQIRKMMAANDWLKGSAAPGWSEKAHAKMKAVLDAQLGEATGFTKKMQAAEKELNKIRFDPITAELMELKKAGWDDSQINKLKAILENGEALKKAQEGGRVGSSFLSELRRDVEVLQNGLSPVDAQIEKLKDQGVGEGKLGEIRKLLELQEKLEGGEKRKTIFAQLAEDLDKASGKVDDIDMKLRELAKSGASPDELQRAAETMLATKKAEKDKAGQGPAQFVGFADLNRTMQAAAGKQDVGERQVSILQRIHEALLGSGRKPDGSPMLPGDKRPGGPGVAGLFGGRLSGSDPMSGMISGLMGGDVMKGISGMLNGMTGGNENRQIADMTGRTVDRLEKLLTKMDTLNESVKKIDTTARYGVLA
jgi:tape measure domain-containing protein